MVSNVIGWICQDVHCRFAGNHFSDKSVVVLAGVLKGRTALQCVKLDGA